MRDQPPSLDGELSQRGTALSAPQGSQAHSDTARSPSQLRVQAQGALLGLAPHNIRYTELVGEGINPTVLRRLYDEVGIRVGTPQPDAATATENMPAQSAVAQPVSKSTAAQPAPLTYDHGRAQT
jgi:hypothetical protein